MSQSKSPFTGVCPQCQGLLTAGLRFCGYCGAPVSTTSTATPSAQPPPLPKAKSTATPPPLPQPSQMQSPPDAGRGHWPGVAMVCGLALPGAGQAYNGKVFRAFLIAIVAATLASWTLARGRVDPLPLGVAIGWQLLMACLAWAAGRGIVRQGGRFAKGGLVWVLLQLWLVASLGLAVLIGLTLAGVLR